MVKLIRLLILALSIFWCATAFAQRGDTMVRLKHGLPNTMKVTNVRVYSASSTTTKISVWISLKKGKVVSVSRGGSDWLITVRTKNSVSTYVVPEKSFKIAGESSKTVQIRALHFAEGS